jgi:hypothetical protein
MHTTCFTFHILYDLIAVVVFGEEQKSFEFLIKQILSGSILGEKKVLQNFHYVHQVYHLAEGRDRTQRFFDEELEEHQPFPTLTQALESLDPHIGFNVEIKWTMQRKVRIAYCTESRLHHLHIGIDKHYHFWTDFWKDDVYNF